MYDTYLKKFGLKKIAHNKIRDFLINLTVYKDKAIRLYHLYNNFRLNEDVDPTTDEINI